MKHKIICDNCKWTGFEKDLVTTTKLSYDVEYIYCPSCGSDDVGDIN